MGMNFPSFLLSHSLPVIQDALLFSAAVGLSGLFITHNLLPAPIHTSRGASDHRYTTAASSCAVSFILCCLTGWEDTLTTPTASRCSRMGRATGGVCFQLSGLKWLTDVWRISCLWTRALSVPSYSKHKQWVGRSEIRSEPGCQNRNIFFKKTSVKKEKKKKKRCSCSL